MELSDSGECHSVSDISQPSFNLKPDDLICAVCLGELAGLSQGMQCVLCRRVFPIIDGVPIFAKHVDSGYGTMSRVDLEELERLCHERGWEQGVTSFLEGKPFAEGDFWAGHLIPETRAAGRLYFHPMWRLGSLIWDAELER
jgi:uncharacterized protein YbaR (Trm112 family)